MGSQRVGHDWATFTLFYFFLPTILIPSCASSSPAFRMMCSAYKLNKQGDNIQPWCTPFPIWNQSIVPYLVLTVASWLAYRFLRRQVRWSGIPICLRIFHRFLRSLNGFIGRVRKSVCPAPYLSSHSQNILGGSTVCSSYASEPGCLSPWEGQQVQLLWGVTCFVLWPDGSFTRARCKTVGKF